MNKIVKRLILQYGEYLDVLDKINLLKNNILISKLKNGKKEIKELKKQLNINEKLLDRISDEMSFCDPIVWIEYKYHAYKKTSKDISTVSDLIQHCLPEGYVCSKRFIYLKKYFDINRYKLDTNLLDLTKSREMKDLVGNNDFMQGWQKYEYNIEDGKISKWGNFTN